MSDFKAGDRVRVIGRYQTIHGSTGDDRGGQIGTVVSLTPLFDSVRVRFDDGDQILFYARSVERLQDEPTELVWTEHFDDNDNSWWEARSPYIHDGDSFMWRLRQKLVENRIEWYADHDQECGGDWNGDSFLSLEEAKVAVNESHQRILQDVCEPGDYDTGEPTDAEIAEAVRWCIDSDHRFSLSGFKTPREFVDGVNDYKSENDG